MSMDNPQTPQAFHSPESPASVYSSHSSIPTPGGANVSSTNNK